MVYEIEERELEPEVLASIRSWVSMEEMAERMGRDFDRITAVLRAQGVEPAGPPLAYYHAWTEDAGDLEVGFPVEQPFVARDGVVRSQLPGGKALFTVYIGQYDKIEPAYNAMQAYAVQNGLDLAPYMWERYLTKPDEEPDLSKHVTHVYWPLVEA
ncbi:MAG: GyrI-like domain-containing protein [Actinobacteria bacterium]|nr:GyrI-like domain-containing protein [Actinomycetota bacterium]